jgi:hypothetical protein
MGVQINPEFAELKLTSSPEYSEYEYDCAECDQTTVFNRKIKVSELKSGSYVNTKKWEVKQVGGSVDISEDIKSIKPRIKHHIVVSGVNTVKKVPEAIGAGSMRREMSRPD